MKKIAIIGNFGKTGQPVADGQTVKTRILTTELQKQYGTDQLICINTYGGWINLLKSPFQCLHALMSASNIIIFPAHNGLRVYAPLLALLKRFYKDKKLHYVVIGGWLPEFLEDRKCLLKALKSFESIYVETQSMKDSLYYKGLFNVEVVPNCKELHILSVYDINTNFCEPYRLCTFSRVSKQKGIGDAVEVVKKVNEYFGRIVYTLDIYGRIDDDQKDWFNILQTSFPEYVKYKGCVEYDRTTEVLKDYFALLFPTYYEGEGFAGTIIDAYAAALPVIASSWKYNSELVENGVTGFVYPAMQNDALETILKNMIDNHDYIVEMKKQCLNRAYRFLPQNGMKRLFEKIEE